jgi:hypothetical protein
MTDNGVDAIFNLLSSHPSLSRNSSLESLEPPVQLGESTPDSALRVAHSLHSFIEVLPNREKVNWIGAISLVAFA